MRKVIDGNRSGGVNASIFCQSGGLLSAAQPLLKTALPIAVLVIGLSYSSTVEAFPLSPGEWRSFTVVSTNIDGKNDFVYAKGTATSAESALGDQLEASSKIEHPQSTFMISGKASVLSRSGPTADKKDETYDNQSSFAWAHFSQDFTIDKEVTACFSTVGSIGGFGVKWTGEFLEGQSFMFAGFSMASVSRYTGSNNKGIVDSWTHQNNTEGHVKNDGTESLGKIFVDALKVTNDIQKNPSELAKSLTPILNIIYDISDFINDPEKVPYGSTQNLTKRFSNITLDPGSYVLDIDLMGLTKAQNEAFAGIFEEGQRYASKFSEEEKLPPFKPAWLEARVTVVPEPSSLVLLGFGFAAIFGLLYRIISVPGLYLDIKASNHKRAGR